MKHVVYQRKGQVWIETVIYTLIGLTLLAVVLGFMAPKIQETRDRIVVDQSIESLNKLDEKLQEVIAQGEGNTRTLDFSMKRGSLTIDPTKNTIVFVLDDLAKPYSEPDVDIRSGRITIRSEQGQKYAKVTLTLSYSANIVYNGDDVHQKMFGAAPVPYHFSMKNEKTQITLIETGQR